MTDDRLDSLCGTCHYWARGASHFAAEPVKINPNSEIGACLCAPPVVLVTGTGNGVTINPMTHETRSCEMWCPDPGGVDYDPDPPALIVPERAGSHLRAVEDGPRAAA